MLINLSNHPYGSWSEAQKVASSAYGEVIDMPFPSVSSEADEKAIVKLADTYLERILDTGEEGEMTVHIMGEQTFCFALISLLLARGIPCVASCTERDVTEMPDGSRQVRFHFARFRPYSMPT